ncbi:MAG: hypothetical protein J1F31_03730 [Erysipelotrichales bacterium]|nr:hypothetical protein [Erysipelotrichales bacterium]
MKYKKVRQPLKISKVSAMHFGKLVGRALLFLGVLALYIIYHVNGNELPFLEIKLNYIVLVVIWGIYALETFLRFFPSKFESRGCQKQFAHQYKPVSNEKMVVEKPASWRTVLVIVSWVILNSVFGVLYYTHVIDEGILILISILYSVCDMICILFFCPFQVWMLKNKCCTTCRIYNWDFIMMFTPLVFIFNPFTLSLFALGATLLIVWEILYAKHPERFLESTNSSLQCPNCNEKLCAHKKNLQKFLQKMQQEIRAKQKLESKKK